MQSALKSVQQMREWPKYIIVPLDNGTCQIVKKDQDGVIERWYQDLTHEEALHVSDVLNTYRHREFGLPDNGNNT
jgi:hypothetical protein